MKFRYLILALLSGMLLGLPFHSWFSGIILFVAWVPLLIIDADCSARKQRGAWKYYALTFFVWNAIAVYTLYHANLLYTIGIIAGNVLVMTLLFSFFRWVKRKTTAIIGYTFLVALWISIEYFFLHIGSSWPWLIIGNGLVKDVPVIQWYDYTGVLGGSLWVGLINLSLLQLLIGKRAITKKQFFIQTVLVLLLITTPIIVSLILYYQPADTHTIGFYEQYGDFIGRVACFVVVLIIVYVLSRSLLHKSIVQR